MFRLRFFYSLWGGLAEGTAAAAAAHIAARLGGPQHPSSLPPFTYRAVRSAEISDLKGSIRANRRPDIYYL